MAVMESDAPKTRSTMRDLLAVLAAIFLVLAVLTLWGAYSAQYAMARSAYGGQRMTRLQAEALAANGNAANRFMLSRLPDSEFLPSAGP
jgi:hypothetical protein